MINRTALFLFIIMLFSNFSFASYKEHNLPKCEDLKTYASLPGTKPIRTACLGEIDYWVNLSFQEAKALENKLIKSNFVFLIRETKLYKYLERNPLLMTTIEFARLCLPLRGTISDDGFICRYKRKF